MSELQKSDYHAPKAKSSAFGYLNTHPHFWVPLSNRAVGILVDGAFSGSEYRVLLLLLSRANLERKEVSAASLAEALGVHVRTVERALNALAKKGVVKRGPFGWGVDPGLLATPGAVDEDKTAGGAPGKTAAVDKRVIPSEEKALKEKKLPSSVSPSSPQNTRTSVHSKSSSSSPPRRRISTPGPIKNPKDQKPGEPRVSSPRGERWAELRLALEQAGLWKDLYWTALSRVKGRGWFALQAKLVECYQHLGRTGFLRAVAYALERMTLQGVRYPALYLLAVLRDPDLPWEKAREGTSGGLSRADLPKSSVPAQVPGEGEDRDLAPFVERLLEAQRTDRRLWLSLEGGGLQEVVVAGMTDGGRSVVLVPTDWGPARMIPLREALFRVVWEFF